MEGAAISFCQFHNVSKHWSCSPIVALGTGSIALLSFRLEASPLSGLEVQLKRKCHGLWPDLLLLMMMLIIMMRLPLWGAARLVLLIPLILFIGLTTPPVRCHKCLVSTRPATCDLSHCMQSHCWHVTCNLLGSNQRKINKCVSVECVCVLSNGK